MYAIRIINTVTGNSLFEILLIMLVSVVASIVGVFVYTLITTRLDEDSPSAYPVTQDAKQFGIFVDILITAILFYLSFLK